MSHGLRRANDSVSGGRGDCATALENIFREGRGEAAARSIGGTRKFQEDPHWRDYILFYEYFHGDNGAGLGASHQTGWTGVIARNMHLFATSTPERRSRSAKLPLP